MSGFEITEKSNIYHKYRKFFQVPVKIMLKICVCVFALRSGVITYSTTNLVQRGMFRRMISAVLTICWPVLSVKGTDQITHL